jgi:O-antigen/teichoic acid export membrane protein
MSKFVTSSIWNFTANMIVRVMSIVTFPFLVRFFLREDISIFKSFQSFVLILMMIIPIGTNVLFLSVEKEKRQERWNLFFLVSMGSSLILALMLLVSKQVSSFFFQGDMPGLFRILLVFLPLIEGFKGIMVTRLSADIDFKGISIALIIKQLFLYASIISVAFIHPTLTILLVIVFFSELMELSLLFNHISRKKIAIKPQLDKGKLLFDKTAKKFMLYSGTEQIILTFAVQFPTIFVVIVLGKTLAPEFQLPFTAVALPVSLVMNSIAKVSFPHYSNLREDDKITNSLFSLLFPVTFLLFPVLLTMHFFAREITLIFFDKTWEYAIFAVQMFPFLMVAYVLGIPSTFISNIKHKPHINLIYAITLLTFRIATIYFGYRIAGFYGTVTLFVAADIIIRGIRLKIDIGLLSLPLSKFFACIRANALSAVIMFGLMWTGLLLTSNKYMSFVVAFLVSIGINTYLERERLAELIKRLLLIYGNRQQASK